MSSSWYGFLTEHDNHVQGLMETDQITYSFWLPNHHVILELGTHNNRHSNHTMSYHKMLQGLKVMRLCAFSHPLPHSSEFGRCLRSIAAEMPVKSGYQIQLSAVITWSNIVRYCINNSRNSGRRTKGIFLRKLSALQWHCTVFFKAYLQGLRPCEVSQ